MKIFWIYNKFGVYKMIFQKFWFNHNLHFFILCVIRTQTTSMIILGYGIVECFEFSWTFLSSVDVFGVTPLGYGLWVGWPGYAPWP